jgi:hypothetical protein
MIVFIHIIVFYPISYRDLLIELILSFQLVLEEELIPSA